MLTDDILHLITAAVDGELSPAEAQRLSQVLYTSPEACQIYARLKADSDRIRALPRVLPPVDLLPRVMARIADATPLPLPFPDQRTVPLAEPAPHPLARKT